MKWLSDEGENKMDCSAATVANLYMHLVYERDNHMGIMSKALYEALCRCGIDRYTEGKEIPKQTTRRDFYWMYNGTMEYYKKYGAWGLPFKGEEKDLAATESFAIRIPKVKRLVLLPNPSAYTQAQWSRRFDLLEGHTIERFKGADKTFLFQTCDATFDNISYLKVCGFTIYGEVIKDRYIPDIPDTEMDSRLYPYQREGVKMLEAGYRLLADEMGTGKTCMSLSFVKRHNPDHVLICCPATLKYNWAKEVRLWTGCNDIEIITGAVPYPVEARYIIINYDILHCWAGYLTTLGIDYMIADESHYIQNKNARRTQAFLTVWESCKDTIFLSGTPFTSRPFQLYTTLHCIAPRIFRSEQDFGNRFCAPETNARTHKVEYKGASNMDVLHEILGHGICIRRLKKDVLKELPEKERVTVEAMTAYRDMDEETKAEVKAVEASIAKAKDFFSAFELEKQRAYLYKRGEIVSWVENFLEGGQKLVVFAVHTKTLDDLEARFGHVCVRIDGSTSQKKRQQAVDRFQNDPDCRLFLGNVMAAGTGLTLTASSNVLMTEIPVTVSCAIQAEDRIHRIGAKNACTVYYLVCPDSIDDKLVNIVNRKAKTMARILDGVQEDNILKILAKEYGEARKEQIRRGRANSPEGGDE